MENSVFASTSLTDLYRAYIDCLNRQDWDELGQYVDDEVEHNGIRSLKRSGWRASGSRSDAPRSAPVLRCGASLGPPILALRPTVADLEEEQRSLALGRTSKWCRPERGLVGTPSGSIRCAAYRALGRRA